MSLRYLLFLITVFAGVSGYGQQIRVVDAKSNEPLPFAIVWLKGAGTGATANEQGVLKLTVSKLQKSDTLCCNYIGYQPFRKAIDASKGVDISEIRLQRSNELKEVVVKYEERPKPLDLLENIIKRTSENYSNQPVRLDAFYRETMQGESRYVQLCEAKVSFYNSSYPQAHDKDAWKRWYYDDRYFMDSFGSSFLEADAFTPNFNAEEDQVKINAVRSATTIDGIAPNGGPLSMTASDKVKYQRDFLDPDLFSRYNYELLDDAMVRGHDCYVLSFHPKPDKRKMITDMQHKTSRAIYLGRIYIDRSSFAVVRTAYQQVTDISYGYHQSRVPIDNRLQIDYELSNGKWYLNYISSSVDHYGWHIARELWIDDVQTINALPFAENETLKHTRWTQLFNYPQVYDESRWKGTLQHQRDKKAESDLASNGPLEDQFRGRFVKNESLMPVLPKQKQNWLVFNGDSIPDNYRWMENIADSSLLSWLRTENNYYRNYLIPYRNQQGRVYRLAAGMYKRNEGKAEPVPGDFYIDTDGTRRTLIYQQDSLTKLEVVDMKLTEGRYPLHKVVNLQVGYDKKYFTVELNKGGDLDNVVLLVSVKDHQVVDSLFHVSSMEWLDKDQILYAEKNSRMRADRLLVHRISTGTDSLIYTENDVKYDVEIAKTATRFLCTLTSKDASEVLFIENKNGRLNLQTTLGRTPGQTYEFREFNRELYVLLKRPNENAGLYLFDPFSARISPLVKSKKKVVLDDVVVSPEYISTISYHKARPQIMYKKFGESKWRKQDLPYKIGYLTFNKEQPALESDKVVVNFSTMENEEERWSFDPSIGRMERLSRDSSYIKTAVDDVVTIRRMVRSGWKKVPLTINYAPSRMTENGLIIQAYGAYGGLIPDDFSYQDVLLMRSGYTVAYAHVRGGGELGESWYRKGKLLHKKNSVKDLIKCTEYLHKMRSYKPEKTALYGNSAGGLVVAAAMNQRPDLYKAVVLDHPYVDVCGTMTNDTLPLTTDEYLEWGDPSDKAVYQYMKSYSPYQNLRNAAYPDVLCLAGYNDQQTPVWTIAKYVAALRNANTGRSEILFHTNMSSGHMPAGGEKGLKQLVEIIAFINASLYSY